MLKSALLLINVQNDYFTGGKTPLRGVEDTLSPIKTALAKFREMNLPVIYTQYINDREGAPSHWDGTAGIEIHKDIAPIEGEYVIKTEYYDCFTNSELLKVITDNHIKRLVICGMPVNTSIDFTVRAAREVHNICFLTILYDACAAIEVKFREEIIPAQTIHTVCMANMGTYLNVINTDDLFF